MNTSDIVVEEARETVVAGSYDVIVCGAGPAGSACAISAARNGASTLLIEMSGCLGGMWTVGSLPWILDASEKEGIMREILQRLDASGELHTYKNRYACNPEEMKILLEDMCAEAGVNILLHTRTSAVLRQDRTITHVITESKSGRQAFAAKQFVDCTGDGDLGALAGCGFDIGRETDGATQPMSLISLWSGLDHDEAKEYTAHIGKDAFNNFRQEMVLAGLEPSYSRPGIFYAGRGTYICMANHIYKHSGLSVNDITDATLAARKEINNQVKSLRERGGVWKNLTLIATANNIGVRESRRLHGQYTITLQDMIDGKEFTDSVCTCRFSVDVHATGEGTNRNASEENKIKIKPYGIPLRSLVSRDVDNLLMGGRCISGDFLAHSSYRVTGDAAAIGEAAGIEASKRIKLA